MWRGPPGCPFNCKCDCGAALADLRINCKCDCGAALADLRPVVCIANVTAALRWRISPRWSAGLQM